MSLARRARLEGRSNTVPIRVDSLPCNDSETKRARACCGARGCRRGWAGGGGWGGRGRRAGRVGLHIHKTVDARGGGRKTGCGSRGGGRRSVPRRRNGGGGRVAAALTAGDDPAEVTEELERREGWRERGEMGGAGGTAESTAQRWAANRRQWRRRRLGFCSTLAREARAVGEGSTLILRSRSSGTRWCRHRSRRGLVREGARVVNPKNALPRMRAWGRVDSVLLFFYFGMIQAASA